MGDGQLLLGFGICIIGIAIQAIATFGVLQVAYLTDAYFPHRRRRSAVLFVVSITGALLLLGHFLQIEIWAKAYEILGVSTPENSYYLAFVSFTTLGYGDVVPAQHWRLLGPMAAASGMLMFGWSTAVLFAVLIKALEVLRFRINPENE